MIVMDFETRSKVQPRDVGTSVYARHESTSVLCLAWCYQEAGRTSEVYLWTPEESQPLHLFEWISRGMEVHAHNVAFERNIWRHVCVDRMDWPEVSDDQWRCSAAACARLALPRSLEKACLALGLKEQKDDTGHKIMMRLSKPKKPSKKDPSIWDKDPAKFQILYDYCKQDVRAEAELIQTIEPLTRAEEKVWKLDQEINERGIPLDREAIEQAIQLAEEASKGYETELSEVTGGAVQAPSQVAKLMEWLKGNGCPISSLGKDIVEETLQGDIPDQCRRALEIRLSAAKSSVKKLSSMLGRCNGDGRVRENLVYHGAGPGSMDWLWNADPEFSPEGSSPAPRFDWFSRCSRRDVPRKTLI